MSYGPRKDPGELSVPASDSQNLPIMDTLAPASPVASEAPVTPEPSAAPAPDPVAPEPASEPAGASLFEPVTSEAPLEVPEDTEAPTTAQKQGHKRRLRPALRRFFLPGPGAGRLRRVSPWVLVLAILVGLAAGGAHMWTWTNSPGFCGELCHTMPPQYASYKLSPHSRVSCVECHIGREFIGKQLPRKAVHTQFVFRMAFGLYEYPLYVKGMRPARDACETCHSPETFSNDSVVTNRHFQPDENNSPYSIYLIMHIGGGTAREGLGKGIHWHIQNKVEYYATDPHDQDIPYVRVTGTDGTVDEYTDVEAGFDPKTVDPTSLKTVDCITCHNRVSHTIAQPVDAVESAMARQVIAEDIPFIRREAVKALTVDYPDQETAFAGIEKDLTTFYETSYPDFYATYKNKIEAAITELKRVYSVSVFREQEIDWDTHPDNVGHIEFPGCFRCHDGKHLNTTKEAIRLECNICHSVPVVSGTEGLVTDIEIQHGPEPSSHRNPNWIALHNRAYDQTCANCHTTDDGGGTSDISFCANSACHGIAYTFAGFDAPALRAALTGQVPTQPGTQVPSTSGKPTWDSYFGSLLTAKCGSCHGVRPLAGLVLTSYASALKGSDNGPVIIPGNAEGSVLVQLQHSGHFAQFTPQQLQAVIDWIDAGAAEK